MTGNANYVAVTIVNYRTADSVETLLDDLALHGAAPVVRICVVDNSMDRAEAARLRELVASHVLADRAQVVVAPDNLGYGRGHNLGCQSLMQIFGVPRVVWALNPDVRILGLDIDLLLHHGTNLDVLSVGRTTLDTRGATSRGLYRLSPWTGAMAPAPQLSARASDLYYPKGHCLLIPGETWSALGGFSDDFFLYSEEMDLALRTQALHPDARVEVTQAVMVDHDGGGSTDSVKGGPKSLLTLREASRSRIVLFRRHRRLRRTLALVVAARLGLATRLLVGGQRAGALAVWCGVRDGLRQPISIRELETR